MFPNILKISIKFYVANVLHINRKEGGHQCVYNNKFSLQNEFVVLLYSFAHQSCLSIILKIRCCHFKTVRKKCIARSEYLCFFNKRDCLVQKMLCYIFFTSNKYTLVFFLVLSLIIPKVCPMR